MSHLHPQWRDAASNMLPSFLKAVLASCTSSFCKICLLIQRWTAIRRSSGTEIIRYRNLVSLGILRFLIRKTLYGSSPTRPTQSRKNWYLTPVKCVRCLSVKMGEIRRLRRIWSSRVWLTLEIRFSEARASCAALLKDWERQFIDLLWPLAVDKRGFSEDLAPLQKLAYELQHKDALT